MPNVTFADVTKRFPETLALDRVSFEVQDGELLVLLGPSGCGKTTTLRIIAGLEEADAGEVRIGGSVVNAPAQRVFLPTEKREIGMVFQSYAIWPHMSVFENVAFPLRVRGIERRAAAGKVERALALVGLERLGDRPATKLSGGQQQRVALARALVFEPRLLLLDEPLSNLDAKLRVHMRGELKQLQQKTGITSVFVTHDQAESMALADRVVVMNQGRIEQIGTPADIYERPRTEFVSDFVGSVNLIPAQVAAIDELGCRLSSGLGDFRSGHTDGLVAGDAVLALVRPEKISLLAQPPDGSVNAWECRVDAMFYYGDHREYHLDTGEQRLKAVTPPHLELARGSRVYAGCDPNDVVVLRRGA
ncbi:MAG: ABC transporter ATP-binding protein [Chloroflexota bacterium]